MELAESPQGTFRHSGFFLMAAATGESESLKGQAAGPLETPSLGPAPAAHTELDHCLLRCMNRERISGLVAVEDRVVRPFKDINICAFYLQLSTFLFVIKASYLCFFICRKCVFLFPKPKLVKGGQV